jgi:hypothetical protein
MSNRDIGDELENKVISKLGEGFHRTGNSGATFKDGDIRNRRLVIECKVKNNTEGFSSPKSELKKLWKEANKQGKDWLYIEQNGDGKVMVLMDFDTFLEMTEHYRAEKYDQS